MNATAPLAPGRDLIPHRSQDFRHVLGHFCSGVTVVTSEIDGTPLGFACQSFSAVSLDPPLILTCVAKTSTSWPRILPTGRFCVNVLAEDQEDLCRAFAAREIDRFRGIGWSRSAHGCPRLGDALAWIDCDIESVIEAGDHDVVIGAVRALSIGDHPAPRPLLFYRGAYGQIAGAGVPRVP